MQLTGIHHLTAISAKPRDNLAGPGFATDEPMQTLGEKLALPPFLEPRRAEIEAGLRQLG